MDKLGDYFPRFGDSLEVHPNMDGDVMMVAKRWNLTNQIFGPSLIGLIGRPPCFLEDELDVLQHPPVGRNPVSEHRQVSSHLIPFWYLSASSLAFSGTAGKELAKIHCFWDCMFNPEDIYCIECGFGRKFGKLKFEENKI